ncbi:MAG: histidine phosphatase family protein [Nitrospiria bacterium]
MFKQTNRQSSTALFLRHGETDYSKNRFYNDTVEDPPLNDRGRTQAGAWAPWLKENDRSIGAVYVSPSRRTLETAELAAQGLGMEAQMIEGLGERHFGQWGGLSKEAAQTRFPEAWSAWKQDPIRYTPPDGESLIGFSIRVKETMRELVSAHPGHRFLVITHAGTIRMAVSAALGVPIQNFKRLIVTHGSMTVLEYTEQWPNLHALSFIPK